MIQMILEGNASEVSNESAPVAVNIPQLIRFNPVNQQRRWSVESKRHSITNKAPLPDPVALMIYLKTRKKTLVNEIASKGLCVRYQRVKDIQRGISDQLCTKYNNDGIVCPPKPQPGLFVASPIGNIDHNLFFPGNIDFYFSISRWSHATSPFAFVSENTSSRRNRLPFSYTDMKPT